MLRTLGAWQQPVLGLAEGAMSYFKPNYKPLELPQGGKDAYISDRQCLLRLPLDWRQCCDPASLTFRLPRAGFDRLPETSEYELSRIVSDLNDKKLAWAQTPAAERAKLLRQSIDCTLDVRSPRWPSRENSSSSSKNLTVPKSQHPA